MANTKSALKNLRKNRSRYIQNRSVSSRLKTLEKKFLNAISLKDIPLSETCASEFISALEKAGKSNLVHSNKISRKKSRCAVLLSTV